MSHPCSSNEVKASSRTPPLIWDRLQERSINSFGFKRFIEHLIIRPGAVNIKMSKIWSLPLRSLLSREGGGVKHIDK